MATPQEVQDVADTSADLQQFESQLKLWKIRDETEETRDEWLVVEDEVEPLRLVNPARLDTELEACGNSLEKIEEEVEEVIDNMPSPALSDAEQELVSTLKEMYMRPGVMSALEEIGAISGYKQALGDLERTRQMLQTLKDLLKEAREHQKASPPAIVTVSSPLAQNQEEIETLAKTSCIADFFLDGLQGIRDDLAVAIRNATQATADGRFEKAHLSALEKWLAWDSENTLVPTAEKNPLPCNHKEMLMNVHKDSTMLKYANVQQLVKTLHEHSVSESMLQTVMCTLEQVLLKICTGDRTKTQPNLLCLRLIELLAYCCDFTKPQSKAYNLFAIWQLKLSHQVKGEVLLGGLANFVESRARGTGNSYETLGYYLRTEAREYNREFPSKSNDQRYLLVDNERVVIVSRFDLQNRIKIAQVEEVELSFENFEHYVVIKRYGIKYKLELAHEDWFSRQFPTIMRAEFAGLS